MVYLFTVAAPARSGTMWFSRLFTTDHSFCYHELTTLLRPFPSNVALHDWLQPWVADHDFEQSQRRWVLTCYPTYFERLWEKVNSGQFIVGNSDHFHLEFLPGLWLLWPDMKFVFAVRNGINCVQSHAIHLSSTPTEIVARQQKRYNTGLFFEQCCHLWVDEVRQLERSRSWLQARANCLETRLEGVTSNIEQVKRVWDWIGIGEWAKYEQRNLDLMRTPLNARTNKGIVVGWESIWENWTREQRETFRAICGETQVRLGYELPRPSPAA